MTSSSSDKDFSLSRPTHNYYFFNKQNQTDKKKIDFLLQQPTWRLWGEERLDGVVYTVYLKKVRYHSPSRSITTVRLTTTMIETIVFNTTPIIRMPMMEFLTWNGRLFASDS